VSNPIPPSVTPPSPHEWPNTLRTITGITNGSTTTVTCPNNGFTSADQNQTSVMFLQVKGMFQINGLPGRIIQVIDGTTFVVDINSTNFGHYASAGVISILTGQPPIENASFQYFNTPFQNLL
jgi:hypothetical protein